MVNALLDGSISRGKWSGKPPVNKHLGWWFSRSMVLSKTFLLVGSPGRFYGHGDEEHCHKSTNQPEHPLVAFITGGCLLNRLVRTWFPASCFPFLCPPLSHILPHVGTPIFVWHDFLLFPSPGPGQMVYWFYLSAISR